MRIGLAGSEAGKAARKLRRGPVPKLVGRTEADSADLVGLTMADYELLVDAAEDAAALAASKAYLSEIETGKKPGSIAAIKRIAKALSVDPDDIVVWD